MLIFNMHLTVPPNKRIQLKCKYSNHKKIIYSMVMQKWSFGYYYLNSLLLLGQSANTSINYN